MYVDYDPKESAMGFNFDVGNKANVDLKYHIDPNTMGAVPWSAIGEVVKNIPFDKLIKAFKKGDVQVNLPDKWLGMKPATAIASGLGVLTVGGLLTYLALKKKKKKKKK